jgi:hypothetical protein
MIAVIVVLVAGTAAEAQVTGEGYSNPPPGLEVFPPPPENIVVPPPDEVAVEAVAQDPVLPKPAVATALVRQPSAALPVTGGDILALGGVGAALVVGGALMLGARRRTAFLAG